MEEKKKYYVDGKQYDSIEEVPEEFRKLIESQGVDTEKPGLFRINVQKNIKFKVNDKEYDSIEQVPEAVRDLLRDKDGDGLPDILTSAGAETTEERHQGASPEPPGNVGSGETRTARSASVQARSTFIKEDSSNTFLYIAIAAVAVGSLVYYLVQR